LEEENNLFSLCWDVFIIVLWGSLAISEFAEDSFRAWRGEAYYGVEEANTEIGLSLGAGDDIYKVLEFLNFSSETEDEVGTRDCVFLPFLTAFLFSIASALSYYS